MLTSVIESGTWAVITLTPSC